MDESLLFLFLIIVPAAIIGLIIKKTTKLTKIERTGRLKFEAKSDYFHEQTSYNPAMPGNFSSESIAYTDFEFSLEGLEKNLIVSVPISSLTPTIHKQLESVDEVINFEDVYSSSLKFTPSYKHTEISAFNEYPFIGTIKTQDEQAKRFLFNLK